MDCKSFYTSKSYYLGWEVCFSFVCLLSFFIPVLLYIPFFSISHALVMPLGIIDGFGLERTLRINHLVPTALPWAGTPPTRPGCPKPHPAWPWTPPRMGHPQLLWLYALHGYNKLGTLKSSETPIRKGNILARSLKDTKAIFSRV